MRVETEEHLHPTSPVTVASMSHLCACVRGIYLRLTIGDTLLVLVLTSRAPIRRRCLRLCHSFTTTVLSASPKFPKRLCTGATCTRCYSPNHAVASRRSRPRSNVLGPSRSQVTDQT